MVTVFMIFCQTFVDDIIWIRREHPVDIVTQNDVSLAVLLWYSINPSSQLSLLFKMINSYTSCLGGLTQGLTL